MQVRFVKPFEIPEHILRQKKLWKLDVFYEVAYRNPEAFMSYVFEKDGVVVGAVILQDDSLYDAILAHTLIIDKAHRTEENVAEATRYTYDLLRAIAREFGRSRIMANVKNPERFLERLGNPGGIEDGGAVLLQELGG